MKTNTLRPNTSSCGQSHIDQLKSFRSIQLPLRSTGILLPSMLQNSKGSCSRPGLLGLAGSNRLVFIFCGRLLSLEGLQLLTLSTHFQINLRDYFAAGHNEDEDAWGLVGVVETTSFVGWDDMACPQLCRAEEGFSWRLTIHGSTCRCLLPSRGVIQCPNTAVSYCMRYSH